MERQKDWQILLAFQNGCLSWRISETSSWAFKCIFAMTIHLKNHHDLHLTVLLLCVSPCHAHCPSVFKLSVFLNLCMHFPLCKFSAKRVTSLFVKLSLFVRLTMENREGFDQQAVQFWSNWIVNYSFAWLCSELS